MPFKPQLPATQAQWLRAVLVGLILVTLFMVQRIPIDHAQLSQNRLLHGSPNGLYGLFMASIVTGLACAIRDKATPRSNWFSAAIILYFLIDLVYDVCKAAL